MKEGRINNVIKTIQFEGKDVFCFMDVHPWLYPENPEATKSESKKIIEYNHIKLLGFWEAAQEFV